MLVQLDPRINGGCDTFHLVSAGTTNAIVIKPTGGQIFGWFIYNSNAASRKVNFYNSGVVPIVGTTTILFSLVIPATSGANVFSDIGILCGNGISISTVTGLADTDNNAVVLNDLIINVYFK